MTKISIILPYKNADPFLDETLDSIQRQDFQHWELIAVNDHSTDSSEHLIKKRSQEDSRINTQMNEGTGIIHALQTAYRLSAGTYITRMDADDIMAKDRLSLMVDRINQSASRTIVTGAVKYFSDEPVSEGYRKYEKWLNTTNLNGNQWKQVYRECVVASPNWMIRKADLDKIGGFADLKYPEDYHLVLKWYQAGFKIACVDQVTLHWREHESRTSRNSSHYTQESFFKLKIDFFLDHEWNGEFIVIWGKNPKSKLITNVLAERRISCINLDLANFKQIENLSDYKLLVAVYPVHQERLQIFSYLTSIGMEEGKNWWWV
jgi:glycosyltransferase involved in cell wall biosynthesis